MSIKIKNIILISLFASLTAVSAFISIPLGPIPFTMQTFAVILSGMILGPKAGAISQIIYILLGLMGLPVFSGFNGGLHTVLKPSFGFLIGFIFASYITGKILYPKRKTGFDFTFRKLFLTSLTANTIIYIFGLPYMYIIFNVIMNTQMTPGMVFKAGCLVFLPGDLIKTLLASLISARLLPKLKDITYKEV